MAEIFVSHSTNDKDLADALVQLIEGGIGIRSSQIFCSSLEEQGIPPGVDFKNHIKQMLGDAKIVIAIISQQYYSSAFCMCELGATWALTKNFIPLLVPPITYADLRGSLIGTQSSSVDDGGKLDSMHAVIVQLASSPEVVGRWNSRKEKFLEELPRILKTIKPIETVSREEVIRLKSRAKESEEKFGKAIAQVSELKEQIIELSKAKDRKAVSEIKKKYSKGTVTFNEKLINVKRLNSALPSVVREALFYRYRGEDYSPEYEDSRDQTQRAVEQNLLDFDEGIFTVNSDAPKVKRAIEALDNLSDFLEELPEDFSVQEYEQKYDDLLDMRSRNFWERHELL